MPILPLTSTSLHQNRLKQSAARQLLYILLINLVSFNWQILLQIISLHYQKDYTVLISKSDL
jgi:hypothetical protein